MFQLLKSVYCLGSRRSWKWSFAAGLFGLLPTRQRECICDPTRYDVLDRMYVCKTRSGKEGNQAGCSTRSGSERR